MSKVLAPEGIDSLITASEASTLCGVALCTISAWTARGKLTPAGLDHRGRKLYRLLDVAKAERATRKRARR